MISLFEKNLMRMKNELRDIKTVHDRGLGTVRFFKREKTFNLPANTQVLFSATIESDEPEWPVCQPFASSPDGLKVVKDIYVYDQNATRIRWYVTTGNAGSVTTGVVASSGMQEIIRP